MSLIPLMAPEMIAQSVSLGDTRESDRVMLLAVELFPLSSLLENVRQSSVLLEFGITTRISTRKTYNVHNHFQATTLKASHRIS